MLFRSARADVVQREADKLAHCMIHAFTLDVPLIAEAKIGSNFSEVK